MTINYENLFPTAVGFTILDRELTDQEVTFVKDQVNASVVNMGNRSSEDKYLLNNEALKDLKQYCHEQANQYFQEIYQPKTNVSLVITQSWVNFTKPGEYHHKHDHPNSFLSGVFYIDVEEDQDRIRFFKSGYKPYVVETNNFNIYNSPTWWFNVKNKALILFPSNFEHCVEEVTASKTRISIAFNTFFVGEIGGNAEATALIVK